MRSSSVALLLLLSANAADADAASWRWDPDSAICSLIQDFGNARLEISRTPANNQTGVRLIFKSLKRGEGEIEEGVIALQPGGLASGEVQLRKFDGKLYVNALTEDPKFLEKLSGASALQISGGDIEPVSAPVKSAAAAVDALRKCEDDRMREWSIDPIAWHALKAAPVPRQPLGRMFNDFDYPLEAMTFLVTGDTITRLDVAADGSVRRCSSINASKYKGFENATCRILRRARFTPALDGSGKPVPAPYVVNVRFRIAGTPRP